MTTPITLNLPDNLYQQAARLAAEHQREVSDILLETLALLLTPTTQPISTLSDREVYALAQLRLSPTQEKRLSQLLDAQQSGTISTTEQEELNALMTVYETRLLQQAQALNESVKRGLIAPLEA
ncbi:hypothetical protein [Spirulina subsalsa]|uniref:hypothetical protein n=1 Tax=Spirulina subsalsa TaxID=54311 RepID=UPI00031A51AF|nr:hypothetical protein [Spirulina subsalsa]